MFTVEPQLNMVDLLKEELRVLKKNEETIYDMFALYQFLQNDGNLNSLIGTTLIEKVIHDFEDPEVTVPYKAANIKDIYNVNDSFYSINKRYREHIGCKKILDEYRASYKEYICFGDIQELIDDEKDKEFNLLLTISKSLPLWALEFLVSDIRENIRMEMLVDLLKKNFSLVLDFKNYAFPRSERDSKQEKIKKLFESLNKSELKKEYLEYLIKKKHTVSISRLQDDFLDFTTYTWNVEDKSISVIPVILNQRKLPKLDDFERLYQSTNYKNLSEDIHNNDDNFILNNLHYYDLVEFISLPNFKLTEEKIKLIVERYRNEYKDYNEFDENSRLLFEEERQVIIDAIIRKAKNQKEYKEMLEYVKYFAENTNLEKERIEALSKKQALQNARCNFSTVLYNLNEHLQETEPSRKLIKNIDFKKNN